MRSIAPIIQRLAAAQTLFLGTADLILPEQWTTKASAEKWSAAEVVSHLVTVESTVAGTADRIIQKVARPIPVLQRLHLPIWLVQARVIRRKSPLPLDATLLSTKERMLDTLQGIRERTVAFLKENEKRDLMAYRWPHPFIGMLNVYEWFEMVAAHQVRHAKQMKEIAEELPKAVTTAGIR